MKIIVVTPEYLPNNIGGGGIAVQSIAQTSRAQSYEIYRKCMII